MKIKTLSLVFILLGSTLSYGQIEDLTPEEQAYKDSIAALNQENATVVKSQEAYNKGIELFTAKKFKESIQSFEQSIKFDPNFTAAIYNKGVAENELNLFKKAVSSFDQLIKSKPNYSKAFFQRGRAYQGLNDYLNAENDYEKSIQLDASNPKAYYNYGTLRFLQADYDGGITSLQNNRIRPYIHKCIE